MLGKGSTSAQIYQVEELESKKESEMRNNEIEKIILENSPWGDVPKESLCKIVPSVPSPIDEHMCDFTENEALERSLTSVLYRGELDGEKFINSKEVDEITLVIEEVEKEMLEDKIIKSFEAIALKQLHECYYSFLRRDGRKKHHSPVKDKGKNHNPPLVLISQDRL